MNILKDKQIVDSDFKHWKLCFLLIILKKKKTILLKAWHMSQNEQ